MAKCSTIWPYSGNSKDRRTKRTAPSRWQHNTCELSLALLLNKHLTATFQFGSLFPLWENLRERIHDVVSQSHSGCCSLRP